MKHIFRQGKSGRPTLLLLHGTGGTESDLLPIADLIDKEASVLSVRGNVLEQGMSRFFRRLREGVFDQEDLIKQTIVLNDFISEAAETYQFDRSNVIAVGYSNGANIAGSLLFRHPQALRAAILHHPMVPSRDGDVVDLLGSRVFIGAGVNDPLCSEQETNDLFDILTTNGAEVTTHWEHNGHQLSQTEVEAAKEWYQQLLK